jgi:hypothetical protein
VTASGPSQTSGNVRCSVAIGGKADIGQRFADFECYLPEALGRRQFYDSPERGFAREIRKRLDYWAKLRKYR